MANIIILYGTETGTAKSAAEHIAKEAALRKLHPKVIAFDDYDIRQLPNQKLVIFVIANTGNADATATMKNSWRFLL